MQQNNSSRNQSKISIQSKNSLRSLSKSLGRPSWQIRQPSLGKKASLVYAMSIQSQRRSDIFQRLLQSQKKPKARLSNIEGANLDQTYQYNYTNYLQRNSDVVGQQSQFQINHQCTCFNQCLKQQCPCALAKQQICIKGSCCILCIQYKNNILRINNYPINTNLINNQSNTKDIRNNKNNIILLNNQNNQFLLNNQNNQFLLNNQNNQFLLNNQNNQFLLNNQYNNNSLNHQNNNFNEYRRQIINKKNVTFNSNQLDNEICSQNNEQIKQQIVCNCKNTQCLKSYCKCFQKGGYCSQKCGCQQCKNRFDSQQRLQAINYIKSNQYQPIYCTCKKTKCNKKYCSCYNSGIKCSKLCSCENCQNCQHNQQMEIQIYTGDQNDNYQNIQMPQRMSFQPVNFQ